MLACCLVSQFQQFASSGKQETRGDAQAPDFSVAQFRTTQPARSSILRADTRAQRFATGCRQSPLRRFSQPAHHCGFKFSSRALHLPLRRSASALRNGRSLLDPSQIHTRRRGRHPTAQAQPRRPENSAGLDSSRDPESRQGRRQSVGRCARPPGRAQVHTHRTASAVCQDSRTMPHEVEVARGRAASENDADAGARLLFAGA